MTAFNCTESTTGPILDVVWAGLNVLGALRVAGDRSAYEDPDQIIVVGLTWGVVSSVAAAVGFSRTKRCRDAKARMAERRARGVTVAPVPPPLLAPQIEVVVAPAVDTLVVGESRQLTATAHYASGAEIPGSEFAWWSHDATIASITGKGVVTARAPGEVTVGATSASVGGAARIVVITRR